MLTVYGGVGYDTQLDTLASGVDIVVGTPGRLIDLANRRALDLSHVHALVLDEADEMLDLGFLPDVERLLSMTPETRQTMLFSATMPAAIVALARTHMRHPMNIRAESSYENATVPATAQFIYLAHDLDKPEIIGRVLQADDAEKMIVFTRTKRQAQRIADDLAERGFAAAPLHGDMAQIAREKALAKFREDKLKVLVCTDVAARGIDVRGVSHVVNYTCPEDDKTYVHRIGRTGRAGATGTAITLVDWPDIARWKMINKTLDLPFPEPTETYSTSEHLFHDQGIPAGTKGRIVDAAPVERKPREDRAPSGDRDRAPRDRNRNRSRSRTRNGAPVEGGSPAAATTATSDRGRGQARRRGPQPQPASSYPLGRLGQRGGGPRRGVTAPLAGDPPRHDRDPAPHGAGSLSSSCGPACGVRSVLGGHPGLGGQRRVVADAVVDLGEAGELRARAEHPVRAAEAGHRARLLARCRRSSRRAGWRGRPWSRTPNAR